jgi:poly-beta-1,6-N-acetyl-D-glucosamine synthase
MPLGLTVKLVKDLIAFNPDIMVVVVDDCTPEAHENLNGTFNAIRAISERVTFLRTPQNKMKAGAINHALNYLRSIKREFDVIITLDDDVVIEKNTIQSLVSALLADDSLGAVCSQCRALNKNKNFLTRLQSLEYLGFNAVRIADEGFFHGPLVMHGMLTAYRMAAIRDVKGFTENHLIEDYEITVRIKEKGWHVRLAPRAYAWTNVPETLPQLWKQRTRWIYGGLTVLSSVRNYLAVIQDLIGHFIFLTMFALIMLSLILAGNDRIPVFYVNTIVILSLFEFVIWYGFQLWLMRYYAERDYKDWLIRLTIIPEFIYANFLTLVLLGSYAFFFFNWVTDKLELDKELNFGGFKLAEFCREIFTKFGYSKSWGTRKMKIG